MNKNEAIAKEILDAAKSKGWDVTVREEVLTITKRFVPESVESFSLADSQYYSILGLLPRTRAGSMWGTNGGGMGASFAISNGLFAMNVSGGNKLVLRKLKEML